MPDSVIRRASDFFILSINPFNCFNLHHQFKLAELNPVFTNFPFIIEPVNMYFSPFTFFVGSRKLHVISFIGCICGASFHNSTFISNKIIFRHYTSGNAVFITVPISLKPLSTGVTGTLKLCLNQKQINGRCRLHCVHF